MSTSLRVWLFGSGSAAVSSWQEVGFVVLTGDDERDGGREVLSTSQGELAGNKTSSRHFVVCLCLAGYI